MVSWQHQPISVDQVNVNKAWSKLYWFCSDFFLTQPTPTFLIHLQQQIKAVDITALMPLMGELSGLCECNEELLIDYTRLFAGIKAGYGPPPPYESLYRSHYRSEEVIAAVSSAYVAAGFGSLQYPGCPPDHIGTELRFMAMLSGMLTSNDQQYDQLLKIAEDFKQQHILSWIPSYCDQLKQLALTPFYQLVARMVKQLLSNMMGDR
ncbi:molecular chaperone TorD family protein [Endozoicomonas sp. SM1973]|uniref:Molecular chaperone TorD family protein n=1 Tax=Spartinivicinus marinus TaxID=2994442 RepID=A0A853I2A4_9GAMM|nr:molecular chaperone TorD family protein [Spartinivicinus marinus]MCX4029797.1 molecular chaperone TorD family protein [Spartinivicinus marinus]NYZ67533.1 molecular chaperone TorD family protein [Spartinivicinus marinus]